MLVETAQAPFAKRRSQDAVDGRSMQGEACAKHEETIQAWLKEQEDRAGRLDSVRSLYETLVSQHRLHGQLSVCAAAASAAQVAADSTGRGAGSQAQVDWVDPRVYVSEVGRLDPGERLQPEPELFAHVVRPMATRSGSVVVAGCLQRGLSSNRRRAVVGAVRQLQDGGGLERGTVGCSETGLPPPTPNRWALCPTPAASACPRTRARRSGGSKMCVPV